MNNDLISREALKKAVKTQLTSGEYYPHHFIRLIDNAPTVETQGEWVRKVDVIQSIAKQYSEHDELVPMWLSIGDIKGGAE